jgi:hypothetical protein
MPNAETSKPTIISTFATDVALLLIMLAGILRLRRRGGGWFDLGRLIWKQVSWQCIFVDRGCYPCADVIMHSRGCPLALACNRRRAHSGGTFQNFPFTPPPIALLCRSCSCV